MDLSVTPADLDVAVITVSDRSAAGEREDRSGPTAVEGLSAAGFTRIATELIPDGTESVSNAIERSLDRKADLILTLGGTGIGPRDLTPEGTRPRLARELPGIAEAIRLAGVGKVRTAVLSRGLAGTAEGANGHVALVVNLAGSPGAARDGVEVLAPLVCHAIHHLRGGGH